MIFIVDNTEVVNGFDYSNKLLLAQRQGSVDIISNISVGRDAKSLDNNYTCISLSKTELIKLRDALIEVCPIKTADKPSAGSHTEVWIDENQYVENEDGSNDLKSACIEEEWRRQMDKD